MHGYPRLGPPFNTYFQSYERAVYRLHTEGGELVAYAIADTSRPRLLVVRLHELQVEQSCRRQKHATQLVHAIEEGVPAGCALEVHVHTANFNALSFYTALNFKQHAHTDDGMLVLRRVKPDRWGAVILQCQQQCPSNGGSDGRSDGGSDGGDGCGGDGDGGSGDNPPSLHYLPSPVALRHAEQSPAPNLAHAVMTADEEAAECEVVASIMDSDIMDGDGESGGESDGESKEHEFGFECPACEDQFPSSSAAPLVPAPPSNSALVPASKTSALVPATSTALTLAYEVPKGASQKARMVVHQKQLNKTCLAAFECSCPAALAIGQTSCLAQFNKAELQQTYNATYGSASVKSAKLCEVSKALHHQIWALKEPFESATQIPCGAMAPAMQSCL